MNLRRPPRPVRRALLATAAAGLAVLAAALWFGPPYPAADPEAAAAGWKPSSSREDDLVFGFSFAHPDSGEVVDLDWYEPTGTYVVSAYVPCGRLPDGFDEYAWPSAAWHPER